MDKCFKLCVLQYIEILENKQETFYSFFNPNMEKKSRLTGLMNYYQEQVRQKNRLLIKRKPRVYERLDKQVNDNAHGCLCVAMIQWSNVNNVSNLLLGDESPKGKGDSTISTEKQSCSQFVSAAGERLKDYNNKLQFVICGNNLIDFNIDAMPAFFWKKLKMVAFSMNNLSYLNLSGRDKETKEKIELKNLVELYASHNRITSIDTNISSLSNLRLLDLAANKLDIIPNEIFLLSNLKVLDLGLNNIRNIPSHIVQLSKLEKLYLDNNKIEVLPFNLFILENLKVLHLQNNNLRKLPSTLISMKNLKEIKIHNNPKLVDIPKVVLKESVDVLKAYLEENRLRGEECYRTKLLIVGQENVGKTSLLRCLAKEANINLNSQNNDSYVSSNSQNKLQRTGKPISTDGIDIQTIFFETEISNKTKNIQFSIWDFAGQEIYYTTHSFFLSERSIYVIVFNLELGANNCKVDHWLNSVKSHSPQSPIILVGTNLDTDKLKRSHINKEMERLYKKYHKTFNIKTTIAVSCETNENISSFVEKLVDIAKKEPYMGAKIPTSYLTLEDICIMERKNKLDQGQLPICKFDKIREIARKGKFFIQDTSNKDLFDAQLSMAIDILHLHGSLLRFKDITPELDNLIILDPQWLTKVFATIITTKMNFIKEGIIEVSTLFKHVWKEYPKDLHVMLLNLLENFEILYRLEDHIEIDKLKDSSSKIDIIEERKERSNTIIDNSELTSQTRLLIPALLSETKPEFIFLWPEIEEDPKRIEYIRKYSFIFMPNGLFSRFLIRLLKYGDPLRFWRYGILIDHKTSNSLALVELDPKVNLITIRVRGDTPSDFFRIIVDLLDSLLTHWFKVSAKITAPCPICVKKRVATPTEFTREECLESSANGSLFLQCKSPEESHLVKMEQIAPDIALSDFEGKRIDLEREITILKELGKGSYGTVYKGIYNKEVVAIKKLNVSKHHSEYEIKRIYNGFRREVWIMSGLQHPCLVQLKGFSLQGSMAMVMEILEHGDLYSYINDHENKLDWDLRLRIAWDIAKGLSFLHSLDPPLLHRDIKSPNILLASLDPKDKVIAKLADFGVAGQVFTDKFAGQKPRERDVTNPVWLAPEILSEEPYATAADVYPYGIILWELYARKHPFEEYNFDFMMELETAIKDGIRPTIPEDCPEDYKSLIQKCIDGDPQNRPSYKEIVEVLLPPLINKYAPEIKPALQNLEDMEQKLIAVKNKKETDGQIKEIIQGTHLANAEISDSVIAMVYTEVDVWCLSNKGALLSLNSDTGKLIEKYEKAIDVKYPILGLYYDNNGNILIAQSNQIVSFSIKQRIDPRWDPIEGYLIELDGIKKKKKKQKYCKLNERILRIFKSEGDAKPEIEFPLDKCIIEYLNNCIIITYDGSKYYFEDSGEIDWFEYISFFIENINECKLKGQVIYSPSEKKGNIIAFNISFGHHLIVLSNKKLAIYNSSKYTKTNRTIIDLTEHIVFNDVPTENISIHFKAVDSLIWMSVDKDILVIDIDEGVVVDTIKSHSTTILSMKSVKDQEEIWTFAKDKYVRIWDQNRKLKSSFKLNFTVNSMLNVGPHMLMAHSDGIGLWNTLTKVKEKELERRHEDLLISMMLVDERIVWTLSNVTINIWK